MISKMKIKEAVKKRWVKALRSGKYRQGEGKLCTTHKGGFKFCCLGVLAHEELDAEWERGPNSCAWKLCYKGDRDFNLLPNKARIDLGLSAKDQGKLVEMNDDSHSFDEIADWIEGNL